PQGELQARGQGRSEAGCGAERGRAGTRGPFSTEEETGKSESPEVVVSVPHSGTRTLLSITGINAREQGLVGAGTWWHFGAHELLLEKYEPWAHIPIRHPLNVAESWASRRKAGDVINAMLNHYRCMFRYLETHGATFYRM